MKADLAFFTFGIILTVITSVRDKREIFVCLAFLFVIVSFNMLRNYNIKKDNFTNIKLYNRFKSVEAILLSLGVMVTDLTTISVVVIFLFIILTSISQGMKVALKFVLCISVSLVATMLLANFINAYYITLALIQPISLYNLSIIIAAIITLAVVCGQVYKEYEVTEKENNALVEELEEKYDLLAIAQSEIKHHFESIKDTNKKLEETNHKLSTSIGEFYTLYQISQAISSILNIKELLKYVNDVIIGVMGVNFSTIAVYDERKSRLKVHTTNITEQEDLFNMTSNINCSEILSTLETGRPLMENYALNDYPFTSGRDINSFICVPLVSKTKKLGIALIEQKLNNAFGDDKMRLLDIICQQVSIAMENAELYQKMHEMANTDWLTGVYNRVYFQQRLAKELSIAEDNGYELSIGIFDIDWFKKFNDTYGHLFGDKVIKTIADVVQKSIRGKDIIARFGGEEFIILMPRTSIDEAYSKLESLREKIENTIIIDDMVTVSVTASFGVASFPLSGTTEREILKAADMALYEAKASGRNCVRVSC